MPLPALVPFDEFDKRVPGGVGESQERAEALLVDASAMVRREARRVDAAHNGWLESGVLTDVPDEIVTVVCNAAKRAFVNPEGVNRESHGDGFAQSYEDASGDVYLKASEKELIAEVVGVVRRTSFSIAPGIPPADCATYEQIAVHRAGWGR